MLELRGLHKSYEGQPLLRGVSMRVDRAETACLLGASGSGKSTILELTAGLDTPEAGQVLWNGQDLASTPPHLRDFGLVFQDYALFPHLNVGANVAFGPRMKRWAPDRTSARVAEVLDLVNLSGLESRSVADLSGGEQQRVALARALAPRPRLLMFDEPLGALDRALREDLLAELRRVLGTTRIPALYVTHDQQEAFRIADRILLLHDGQIVREGAPGEVWARPGSAWAAAFLGLGTVLAGRVRSDRKIHTRYGAVPLHCAHSHRVGQTIQVLARPTPTPRDPLLGGTVSDVVFQKAGYRIVLRGGLYYDAKKPAKKGTRAEVRLPCECLERDSAA